MVVGFVRVVLMLVVGGCLNAEPQGVISCECQCLCADDSEPEGACDEAGCCTAMCSDMCVEAGTELSAKGEACTQLN